MNKGVQQRGLKGHRYGSGVAFVIIPADVEREEYVQRCYRTETVALYTENTEVLLDTPIHQPLLQQIEFPESSENLGSMVVWINQKIHNKPIVVGLLPKNDTSTHLSEHYAYMRKAFANRFAQINLRGDKGTIDVITQGQETGESKINISVNHPNQEGELNVEIEGSVNVLADKAVRLDAGELLELTISNADESKKTVIRYSLTEGLLYIDEFGNEFKINDDGIFLNSELIQIGDGADFGVLYNKLVAELKKVEAKADRALNAIQLGTTNPTPDGGAAYKSSMVAVITATPLQNADYTQFKSEKLKLD